MRAAVRKHGHVRELFWMENRTNGGSYETPTEKVVATNPTGLSSTVAHSAVIPEGKNPNAERAWSLPPCPEFGQGRRGMVWSAGVAASHFHGEAAGFDAPGRCVRRVRAMCTGKTGMCHR